VPITDIMKNLITLTIVVLSFLVPSCVEGQQASVKCAPVTPRSGQEALQMEQSSNKDGCWVRQKHQDGSDGPIVFVANKELANVYKHMSPRIGPPNGVDSCSAQRADVAKLQQWVDSDRTTRASTLQHNLEALSRATTAMREKCKSSITITCRKHQYVLLEDGPSKIEEDCGTPEVVRTFDVEPGKYQFRTYLSSHEDRYDSNDPGCDDFNLVLRPGQTVEIDSSRLGPIKLAEYPRCLKR
jgi:hypothetical protein